ncbi:MAG: phosphatidate cytidylyltransferase [Desulfobacterales bacterium]|nr:phosphatidate cytidylyltransferase [Desulfobacterales bacterium]
MHLKRWITAIIALPLLYFLIGKGSSEIFSIITGLICILSLREYFRIVYNNNKGKKPFSIILWGFIIGPAIVFAMHIRSFEMVFGLIIFSFIVPGFFSLFYFKNDKKALEFVFKNTLGMIYIPLLLSCLVLLRNGDNGSSWIFLLLAVVFAGDSGAFYAGSYLGRHKLCPAVSPNKTIEGSIGGLVSNVAVGFLFSYLLLPDLHPGLLVLFCLTVGAAAQVGDLFESELKRSAGIKDSGNILPGHGGILDRIDALLFALPVAYFIKEYIIF